MKSRPENGAGRIRGCWRGREGRLEENLVMDE